MNAFAGFGRTLAFAAAAGLAAPIGIAALRVVLGAGLAVPAYVIGVAALYVFGLARRPVAGVVAAIFVALSGALLLLASGSLSALAVLCALEIAVLRSACLRPDLRASVPRAIAIEAALVVCGLLLAAWLVRGSFYPVSLALWGFFLAQSAFFLIGGPTAQAARDTLHGDVDPFDRARSRALSLLEEAPRR